VAALLCMRLYVFRYSRSETFTLSTAPTRGHYNKLVKPKCQLDVRKFSFAHQIIDIWNSLDENIVACDSFNSLKIRIDTFLKCRGLYKLLSFLPSN